MKTNSLSLEQKISNPAIEYMSTLFYNSVYNHSCHKSENWMKIAAKTKNHLKTLGIFGLVDAKRIGISQPSISRMLKAHEIERLGHGLYIHPVSKLPHEEIDFIVACSKFGKYSIVAGLTALFHYGLIEQVPSQIWVLVDKAQKTIDNKYRLLRVKRISPVGITDNGRYRMTNIERTLVEALQYSSKIGVRTAISSILKAINEKKTTLAKLMKMARDLGKDKVIKKYWETIVGALEAQT